MTGYIFGGVCLTALILLAVAYIRQCIEIEKLNSLINAYLLNGKTIDFSLRDRRISRLRNGISDLQNLVTLEQEQTKKQLKKNTEFILDVSHQLKTPLAALRLYCEMDCDASPHGEKQLRLIDKLESLVANLLKLEKIRSDGYVMEFSKQSIDAILREITGDFALLFPEKRFNVVGDGELSCDGFWLREAFSNIIKNSAEHTQPDGIINITVTESERAITVEVRDNGEGVSPEDLTGLFTRFYKAKNASSGSAGLGLAITKAITEKHHGIISAENRDGSLCVTMCFPIIEGVDSI